MKYYFELTTKTPDIFDADDADYMLFLSNTLRGCKDSGFDDSIGMHSDGVASVVKQLGINDSEMENTFAGKFTEQLPDYQSVKQCLIQNGWEEYKGPSFIPSDETDFDIEDVDESDYDDDDFEFEVEDDDDDYADMYDDED